MASLSATAVKKNANARTAAQAPTLWNRSARLTSSFQLVGGALSCQSAVALLIGGADDPDRDPEAQREHGRTPKHKAGCAAIDKR
jgi:hypothetical protein